MLSALLPAFALSLLIGASLRWPILAYPVQIALLMEVAICMLVLARRLPNPYQDASGWIRHRDVLTTALITITALLAHYPTAAALFLASRIMQMFAKKNPPSRT